VSTRGWEAVTPADLAAKASKYHNRPTTVDGFRFDSQREAEYWIGLQARAAAGEITGLRRQVCFPLLCPVEDRASMVAVYIADFVYVEAGRRHVVDVKGHRTQIYTLKKRWLRMQDGIEIEEV
jgi:hypothetical protein